MLSARICKSAFALALAFGAQQAAALSCVPMGPGDVYRFIAEEEADYVVLEGQLDFDGSALPQGGNNAPKDPVRVHAWFSGLMLGERFFDRNIEGEILLEAHCSGPWCGTLDSGRRYVLFARQEADHLVVPLDPCVSFAFSAADGAAGDVVLECHKGLDCPSELPTELMAPAEN